MKLPVMMLGSGGHAKVLLDILRRLEVDILGVADPAKRQGDSWLDLPVLGGDEVVADYGSEDIALINGLGSLPRDAGTRSRLFETFAERGYRFGHVVDPTCFLAGSVELAAGVQIMAGAIIQAGTHIAENTIVNSGAIVEHDCVIGRHVHVAPGAVLSGGVEIGDRTHVGAGAVVIQGIRVGAGSVIGAGSVVTRDVAVRQIVYPARSQLKDIES
ncbi:acetyltransferase [Methylococcaceae bacterium WWC4]|nr:acetyltransferase [Methylococcaceae bacterium WWC4]